MHDFIVGDPFHFHMWFVFIVSMLAMVAYFKEWIPMESVSLSLIATFFVFFAIFPMHNEAGVRVLSYLELLNAFSNQALITVMSMLIIGNAVIASGSLNALGKIVKNNFSKRKSLIPTIIISIACIVSAFINNTPVVLIFIPILDKMSKELSISQSKLMMPLAYATSCGGMLTLFGNSTNMLIASKITELGLEPVDIFFSTLPGAIVCVTGMLYVILIMPYLLPERESLNAQEHERHFILEINITEQSGLVGVNLQEFSSIMQKVKVKSVQRDGVIIKQPFDDDLNLELRDILTIVATKEIVTNMLNTHPSLIIEKDEHICNAGKIKKNLVLIEAVVSTSSNLIGCNVGKIDVYRSFEGNIVGIQRRSKTITKQLSKIKIIAGDLLLILCERENKEIIAQENSQDFVFLEDSTEEIPNYSLIRKVNVIFMGVIGMSIFKILPIVVSSLLGAVLLLVSGCISIRQLVSAIDRRVFLVISSAYMMSLAMDKTGGIQFIVDNIVSLFGNMGPFFILGMMFVIIMFLNEIISNNAVGLVFTPIAIKLSNSLGTDPKMFLWGVLIASSCAFSTPIGYQTNLLVMTPGNYKITDYIKSGVPLSIIMCTTYLVFARYYFS